MPWEWCRLQSVDRVDEFITEMTFCDRRSTAKKYSSICFMASSFFNYNKRNVQIVKRWIIIYTHLIWIPIKAVSGCCAEPRNGRKMINHAWIMMAHLLSYENGMNFTFGLKLGTSIYILKIDTSSFIRKWYEFHVRVEFGIHVRSMAF